MEECTGYGTVESSGECEEPLGVRCEVWDWGSRFPSGALHAGGGDELAEVGPAGAIADEEWE